MRGNRVWGLGDRNSVFEESAGENLDWSGVERRGSQWFGFKFQLKKQN